MLNNNSFNILFLGCGNMGRAVVQTLQHNLDSSQISIIKPTIHNLPNQVAYFANYSDLPSNYIADIVFLAIKPQQATEILPLFAKQKFLQPKTVIITMLAGKKLEFYEQIFAKNTKIIRIMPNLNIEVNCGIVAYFANQHLENQDLKILQQIFDKQLFALPKEADFDITTAIFGCGPAYLFLLQEIFNQIASEYQINQPQLIIDLFLGSAMMMQKNTQSPAFLQQMVASKKGATASALEILKNQNQLQNIFKQAIAEAVKTASQL